VASPLSDSVGLFICGAFFCLIGAVLGWPIVIAMGAVFMGVAFVR